VFIEHIEAKDPRAVLSNFFNNNAATVGFVAQFVGPFFAFARVEVATFKDLHRLIATDYWSAGVRCSWSTVVHPSSMFLPKKSGTRFCALLRITTSQGEDPITVMTRLEKVFEDWGDHVGIAVVTGDYDILMTIGAEEADNLLTAVLEKVREVRGVGSTETAFADLEDNSFERELV
jgi:hypothetical protein